MNLGNILRGSIKFESDKPRIDSITIVHKHDDTRYGDEFDEDEDCIGIYAKAEVSYQISSDGCRRIEWLRSGGLWGILINDTEEYIGEIEEEQLDDLKDHLSHFNIDLSNFDSIEIKYKRLT